MLNSCLVQQFYLNICIVSRKSSSYALVHAYFCARAQREVEVLPEVGPVPRVPVRLRPPSQAPVKATGVFKRHHIKAVKVGE